MSTNRLEKLIEEYRRLAESHPHGASSEESSLLDEARAELEAIRKAARAITRGFVDEQTAEAYTLLRAIAEESP